MSRVRWASWALLAVAIPSVAPGETLTTLFFDDFEAETQGISMPLTHWDTLSGSVDVLDSVNLCADGSDASQCVDLDGTSPPGGSIQTKALFALAPGSYRLFFDLAGSQRRFRGDSDTVTVTLGSYLLEDITLDYSEPFSTFRRDFLVAAQDSVRLRFDQHGADQVGLLLDNVRLTQVECNHKPDPEPPPPAPQPVPEPVTILLVGTGLVLLLWRRIRVGG